MNGRLQKLIEARGPIRKAGVIGMGYVGIPSAVLLADCPTMECVYGFQRDSPSSGHKIAMLNRGESPLKGEEPGLETLIKKVVAAGSSAAPATSLRSASWTQSRSPYRRRSKTRKTWCRTSAR